MLVKSLRQITRKASCKMKKHQDNSSGKLRSVQAVMSETNLSRSIVMQLAEEAGAIIRYNTRGIRIDIEQFYSHLRKGKQ